MDTKAKTELIVLYHSNSKVTAAAIRKYCSNHGIKNENGRPTESLLRRLVKKFEEHGTVNDLPKSGRGDKVTNEDTESVLQAMNELKERGILPSTSNISKEVGRSRSCVWNILRKDLKFKAYKIQTGQKLSEEHKIRRLSFCEAFLEKLTNDESFLDRVIFPTRHTSV